MLQLFYIRRTYCQCQNVCVCVYSDCIMWSMSWVIWLSCHQCQHWHYLIMVTCFYIHSNTSNVSDVSWISFCVHLLSKMAVNIWIGDFVICSTNKSIISIVTIYICIDTAPSGAASDAGCPLLLVCSGYLSSMVL